MDKRICRQCQTEFTPEYASVVNCPACRQKNVEKQTRSRQTRILASGVDADTWTDNFDTEYPELVEQRRKHSKEFRETVQTELNTVLPWDVQLDVLDAVADVYIAIKNQTKVGWIQKVLNPDGVHYAGVSYADVICCSIAAACAAHSLDKSETFRQKYLEVLTHLNQKFGQNVTNHDEVLRDNALAAKRELERLGFPS